MFNEIKLDLQGFAKRVYDSVLYQSTFYNFLNTNYIGTLRQTGAPVIEVAKTDVLSVNVRETKEIQTALDPALTTYTHTMVNLTELNMDYAIRVPIMVTGSDITNAIQDAADLEDSAIANQIDIYGYGKLASTTMDEVAWNPSTKEDYISALNNLRATLFNKKITGDYRLGLGAVEYGNLVSALTSVIKFENMDINEGVSLGEIARVYGISIFEINDNVLTDAKGYFFNPIAVVGDTFFSAFVSTSSDIRYPGYFCLSGTQSFGAEVVRPEAIVRLVEEVSA
jgi:hypothetical protein